MHTAARSGLCVLLLLVVAGGASAAPTDPGALTAGENVDLDTSVAGQPSLGDGPVAADEAEIEADDEAGGRVLGDWWGLGGEANEAPYIGLVELGVALLALGVAGYSLGKRTGLVPTRYRRYLLQTHEWTMLVGTALTVPHFVAVEEWEGLGLAVAILLAIEVLSGLYGRHLHRHVVRLGRGAEDATLVGQAVRGTKRTVFRRWRQVHVSLTLVTALVIVLHVVTAVAD